MGLPRIGTPLLGSAAVLRAASATVLTATDRAAVCARDPRPQAILLPVGSSGTAVLRVSYNEDDDGAMAAAATLDGRQSDIGPVAGSVQLEPGWEQYSAALRPLALAAAVTARGRTYELMGLATVEEGATAERAAAAEAKEASAALAARARKAARRRKWRLTAKERRRVEALAQGKGKKSKNKGKGAAAVVAAAAEADVPTPLAAAAPMPQDGSAGLLGEGGDADLPVVKRLPARLLPVGGHAGTDAELAITAEMDRTSDAGSVFDPAAEAREAGVRAATAAFADHLAAADGNVSSSSLFHEAGSDGSILSGEPHSERRRHASATDESDARREPRDERDEPRRSVPRRWARSEGDRTDSSEGQRSGRGVGRRGAGGAGADTEAGQGSASPSGRGLDDFDLHSSWASGTERHRADDDGHSIVGMEAGLGDGSDADDGPGRGGRRQGMGSEASELERGQGEDEEGEDAEEGEAGEADEDVPDDEDEEDGAET
ncbi:hypothetical protein FNF29_03748 [Cafeteria roenbergensis]|uniref:Uncharacterized protein n=1 Tax=Cafeteria roenbergensis TaxID=33653 RepID=A0A5A8CL29_CAFRO|nr:hypothetical protein FNF29_03748 [Cafeteria roenbergensis]|eukprot:KAA0152521.1 hypothetical protein FNF29_03748 [Cafeteria roenbergensis]